MTKKFLALGMFLALLMTGLLAPTSASAHDPNYLNFDFRPDGYPGPSAKGLRCLTNPERPTSRAYFVYPESKAGTPAADLDAENDDGWTRREYVRKSIRRANGIVDNSSNGTQTMRWHTNANCDATVTPVAVPDNVLTDSRGALFSYMVNAGYTDDNTMYHFFTDTTSIPDNNAGAYAYNPALDAEADGLIAPFKHRNNPGNGGLFNYVRYMSSGWASEFTRYKNWSGDVIAHETFHNMGAVSEAAPRSNADGYHSSDRNDLVSAPGPTTNPCGNFNYNYLADCNYDDYYAPPSLALDPSNYLADHWNTGNSSYLYGSDYPVSNSTRGALTPTFTSNRLNSGRVYFDITAGEDTETAGYVASVRPLTADGSGVWTKKFVTNEPGLDYIEVNAPPTRVEMRLLSVNNRGFASATGTAPPPL